MIKKFLFLAIAAFPAIQLSAQIPEDAIRMSWNAPSGTARSQAIGGAIGSLGGDITSTFVNPAGIGVYKTSEFVFTPSINFFGGKGSFRGTGTTAPNDSKFNLGATGFVLGAPSQGSKWTSKAFSIAINRVADFNSEVRYRGNNDFSSFSESFAEEFANSGLPINTPLFDAPLSYGTKLANYTYLIDTVHTNGGIEVIGLPQRGSIVSGKDFLVSQEKTISSYGGITEIAIGYAANMDDKLYIGGSLGIPIVKYGRTTILTETDETGDNDNDFGSARYVEDYDASGGGFNLKLGMIMKPTSSVRAGFAIHTPTIYSIREATRGSMEVNTEGLFNSGPPITFADEDTIYYSNGYDVPRYRYDFYSPWRFILSGSYVFSGVEDVAAQKGFISADVEYVTHRSSRFKAGAENGDAAYYDGVNDAIKFSYKGAFNVRVGGEMKFNTFMTRLGFNYFGNPYEDSQLKARKMNVSGGVGYRNKGIFVDAAYVYGFNRDVDFPYRLGDKANTFADVRNNNSSVLVTVGFKF